MKKIIILLSIVSSIQLTPASRLVRTARILATNTSKLNLPNVYYLTSTMSKYCENNFIESPCRFISRSNYVPSNYKRDIRLPNKEALNVHLDLKTEFEKIKIKLIKQLANKELSIDTIDLILIRFIQKHFNYQTAEEIRISKWHIWTMILYGNFDRYSEIMSEIQKLDENIHTRLKLLNIKYL